MNNAELRALAERVEGLQGPSKTVDLRVWEVLEPQAFNKAYCDALFMLSRGTPEPEKRKAALSRMRPPAYTASLDAAMILGRDFLLVAMSDIAADGLPGVCLCSDTSTTPPREHWGIALGGATGPREQVLARCYTAAALHARAATMETDDE